jgi:ATP-dependent Clp protease ATP-binding subunit ClpC
VFERFTERARQVVVLAQDEARLLKHNYIGTEHLLLGLLREDEGLAARLLEALGITLDQVRRQVRSIIGEGEQIATGQIPFTPRGKKVLEMSMREALSLGHKYIGTEHILLGLVRVGEGVGAQILRDFGADADRVRDEVIRMLSGPGRRQRASLAAEPVSEHFEPQSPPLAPDVAAELARLSHEKQEAMGRQEFERAAWLSDRERRLIAACRQLIRVWNEKNELT